MLRPKLKGKESSDQTWRRRRERRRKMVGANLKAETMALMDKRTAMEKEMKSIVQRLCNPGGPGLSGNLIDSEGFPREDIDIPMVRAERHRLAELRSEHSEITEKINVNIETLHSVRPSSRASSTKDSGSFMEEPSMPPHKGWLEDSVKQESHMVSSDCAAGPKAGTLPNKAGEDALKESTEEMDITVSNVQEEHELQDYQITTRKLSDSSSLIVLKRFRDVFKLAAKLAKCYKVGSLPPLPDLVGKRFSSKQEAMEARRVEVEKYLRSLIGHPVTGNCAELKKFFSAGEKQISCYPSVAISCPLGSISWWDLENVPLPKRVNCSRVFPLIEAELKAFGFKPPSVINAIAAMETEDRVGKNLKSLLKSKTWSCESEVKYTILGIPDKQAADTQIIEEIYSHIASSSIPRPPAALMFFGGDLGFFEILQEVQRKGYTLLIVYTINAVSEVLLTLATYHCSINSLLRVDTQIAHWQKFDFTDNESLARVETIIVHKYQNEVAKLEAKYHSFFTDLDIKRRATLEDIPRFWLTAIKNNGIIGIKMLDEEALSYLKDIKWCKIEEANGFRLEFSFGQNPFFENTVLTKSYYMADDVLEKAIGTEIDWCPAGVCVTEDCESFFHFFNNSQHPDADEDTALELMKLMKKDYGIGSTFREEIIPNAVTWFTGEARRGV